MKGDTLHKEVGPNKSDWCPVCKTGWGAYPREKKLRQQREAELATLRKKISFFAKRAISNSKDLPKIQRSRIAHSTAAIQADLYGILSLLPED